MQCFCSPGGSLTLSVLGRLRQASTGVLGLHGTGRTAHRRLGSPHLDRDLQVVSPTPLLLPETWQFSLLWTWPAAKLPCYLKP